MKKSKLVGIVVLVLLILGFIIPQFINPYADFCTKKMCYANEPTAEVECNDCSQSQPLFISGLIDVIKRCQGKEILVFEDSQHMSEKDYIKVDQNSCRNTIRFIGIWIIKI